MTEEKRMLAEINYCRVCDFILPVGSGDCWKCANPQHAYRYDDPVHVAYLGYTDPFEAGKAVAGSLLESDDFQLGEIEATAEVMDALEELGVIKQPDRDVCGDNFAEDWFTYFWINLPDWESV